MKVVINRCYGGFSISRAAFVELRRRGNTHAQAEPDIGEMYPDGSGPRRAEFLNGKGSFGRDIPRHDPDLVAVVNEMGKKANGEHAELAIITIPDDVEYEIEDYDGVEWVAEKHRTWR